MRRVRARRRRRSRSTRARRRTCRRSGATSARRTAASATASRRRRRPTSRPDCGVRSPADVRYRRRQPGLESHPARRLGARRRPLQGADALHAARVPRGRELRDARLGLHGQSARVVAVRAVRRRRVHSRTPPAAALLLALARRCRRPQHESRRAPAAAPMSPRRLPPSGPARRRAAAPAARVEGRRGSAAPLAAHRERSRRLAARRVPTEPRARRTAASSAWKARPAAGCSARRCASACASTPTGRCSHRFNTPSASEPGGLSALRFAGTIDPTWHATGTSSLALGLGFGGIVEGGSSRPDVDPLPSTIETSYTFPSASPPLPGCSGVGVGGAGARGVDVRARAALGDQPGPRGARAVDRLRGRDRARRARQRAGDRAAPVLAARRRAPAPGASRGAEARAPASAALALATVALLAGRARAPRTRSRPRPTRGAPDAAPRRRGAPDAGADARAVFEPPRALTDTQVPYPADAPPINEPVSVTVKLLVDTTGAVTKVELLTPPAPPFDEAVMTAARGFRFDPGRYGGKPVAVAITFTQKFLPRALPPTPAAPADAGAGTRADGHAARAPRRARHAPPARGTRRSSRWCGDQYYRPSPTPTGTFACRCRPGPRACRSSRRDHTVRTAGDARGPARAGGDLPRRARTLQP